MQSYSDPLNRLFEDCAWFSRAHEVRLLIIRASDELRSSVLKLLPGFECHADNFSPWIIFEDAYTKENDGWIFRSNRLTEDWEIRRKAFAKEGIVLGEVTALNIEEEQDIRTSILPMLGFNNHEIKPLDIFFHTVKLVLNAIQKPLDGLVVVLAPGIIEKPKKFFKEFSGLIDNHDIEQCRFIIVINEQTPFPQDYIEKNNEYAMVCDCTIDQEQKSKDIKSIIESTGSDIGAWPQGVKPPKRINDIQSESTDEMDKILKESGINPQYLDLAPKIQKLVFGAAMAMSEGDADKGIKQQTEARDLAMKLEMHELTVILQITLANYLSACKLYNEALEHLQDAVSYSETHELPKAKSQAHLASGLLFGIVKQYDYASIEYVESARAAEIAKIEMLAIESWRLAGQMAMKARNRKDAIAYFKESIRVTQGTEADVVKMSSASEAARQLAKLLMKRGMVEQAQSLYDDADHMEAGEFGVLKTK